MANDAQQPSTTALALHVPDGKRGLARIPPSGVVNNTSCLRCGARATTSQVLLIDGRYQHPWVLGVMAMACAPITIALPITVPMLAFMRRVSRDRARVRVKLCAQCDGFLAKRTRMSRVLEVVAALLPTAGMIAGDALAGTAGVFIGPLVGAIATVIAIPLIERRNPDDRVRVHEIGTFEATLLDVPASWKSALQTDPNPAVASLIER